jgi:two-component system, sensor histidine kinase PdtaS
VPDLGDLARRSGDLADADLDWLHLLVGEWQLLADLSFADLLLWVATSDQPGFVAVAQIRPVTSQTAYVEDKVGLVIAAGRRPLVDRAWREGRIVREGDPEWGEGIPVREETIPVRHDDRVIAVVARHTNLATARTPSRLELTYLATAADLARMVAEGRFPSPGGSADSDSAPRAGDGMLRLDADGAVSYASPNAVSAYRRLGFEGDFVGVHLGEITTQLAPSEDPVEESLSALITGSSGHEADVEVEAHGVVVRLRTIPLLPGGERTGSLVLLRDVTELRRRERALLSKDATIREIHHRVKNNLQTVAALLRLQARRLEVPEGRAALDEAVRRVRAIAVVHDTLAHTIDGPVEFDDIADRLIAMVSELSSSDARARTVPVRVGSFGQLPAGLATPLSMVLTELLQNAIEHGVRDGTGTVEVAIERNDQQMRIVVADDGAGLPAGFSLATCTRLGLQIVRTLVEGDLAGQLELVSRPGGGTRAVVKLAVSPTE